MTYHLPSPLPPHVIAAASNTQSDNHQRNNTTPPYTYSSPSMSENIPPPAYFSPSRPISRAISPPPISPLLPPPPSYTLLTSEERKGSRSKSQHRNSRCSRCSRDRSAPITREGTANRRGRASWYQSCLLRPETLFYHDARRSISASGDYLSPGRQRRDSWNYVDVDAAAVSTEYEDVERLGSRSRSLSPCPPAYHPSLSPPSRPYGRGNLERGPDAGNPLHNGYQKSGRRFREAGTLTKGTAERPHVRSVSSGSSKRSWAGYRRDCDGNEGRLRYGADDGRMRQRLMAYWLVLLMLILGAVVGVVLWIRARDRDA